MTDKNTVNTRDSKGRFTLGNFGVDYFLSLKRKKPRIDTAILKIAIIPSQLVLLPFLK